jgi:hypothetical protein
VLRGPASKASPRSSFLPEDKRAVDGSPEPKDHIDEVDPNRILHANNAFVALRVLLDIHLPEDAKQHQVEEESEDVDGEEDEGLDEGHHEDEGHECAEGPAEDGVRPLCVYVFACLARAVEVLCVEADDNDAHDELEEPDKDARCGADAEGTGEVGFEADLFSLHRSTAEEVKHCEDDCEHS